MNNQQLLIAALIIPYVFSPTLLNWIINPKGSWLRPYIIWFFMILAAVFVYQLWRKDDRP